MALQLKWNPFTNNFDWVDISTATPSTTPAAGSDQQIQFNSGGFFAASANLVFDAINLILSIAGIQLQAVQSGSDWNLNIVPVGAGKLQYNGTEVKKIGPEYTSPDQTITAAGSLSLAHGLGVTPTQVWAVLICQTAEFGYSVGDIACLHFADHNAASRGLSISPDATNINIRFSSVGIIITDKGTGDGHDITLGNWKIRFYANR